MQTLEIGSKVEVKRPLEFACTFEGDNGTVTKVRTCPVLLRQEFLIEFLDGSTGWYPAGFLKVRES